MPARLINDLSQNDVVLPCECTSLAQVLRFLQLCFKDANDTAYETAVCVIEELRKSVRIVTIVPLHKCSWYSDWLQAG
jgi:hypothetical protein